MRLSYCACFALCPFLLCKPTYAQDRREFWPGSRRQLRVIEAKIRNCTEAIARMGWSTFLRAQLQDLESQHRELADKLAALEPRVVKSTFRDTRRFVEARLKNLQSMLTGEPRLVRAEIAKHVEKITLTPEEGPTSQRVHGIYSGLWLLEWCRGPESNWLRPPFQGGALPVSYPGTLESANFRVARKLCQMKRPA